MEEEAARKTLLPKGSAAWYAPVFGRKADRPELRSGLVKLEGDRGHGSGAVLDANDATTLLHFRPGIDENDGLTCLKLHFQFHETTVSVHHFRARFFFEYISMTSLRAHNDGHLQHDAFATPAIAGIGDSHVRMHRGSCPHYTCIGL